MGKDEIFCNGKSQCPVNLRQYRGLLTSLEGALFPLNGICSLTRRKKIQLNMSCIGKQYGGLVNQPFIHFNVARDL